MIFTRKINKISDICPKMPEFYVIIARKINYIFENFIGEGHVGCPPYPTSMTARTISPTCTFALRSQKAIHIFPGEQGKIRGGPFGISAWARYLQKTRFFGLSVSEEIFVPFTTISERDGQTDGHHCYSNTSTCIACYDTALVKKFMLSYTRKLQTPLLHVP